MKYRSEIDGLRAIAVVPVILFHAGSKLFNGGYIGVDIFFVISGYLITSLIAEDIDNDQFTIVGFYERRARRILPALFLVMTCCIPFSWYIFLPSEFNEFSLSLVAVTTFSSNLLFWYQSGYFAPDAEFRPLLHTWSLAVEEQYYVLFPPVLLFLWKFGRRRLLYILLCIAIISFSLCELGWRFKPSANFYLAPTRVWELVAGAICALWLLKLHDHVKTSNYMSCLGLILIIIAIISYDKSTPYPSAYTLVPVTGAVLVLVFGHSGTIPATLLSSRPLVTMGLISYSAYLWHQPLFAFARIYHDNLQSDELMMTLAALSIALGYASWRFVEVPFRTRRYGWGASRFLYLSACGVGSAAFIAIGAYGITTRGVPTRFTPEIVEIAEAVNDIGKYRMCSGLSLDNINAHEECRLGKAKSVPDFVLFGDSHAVAIADGVNRAADNNNKAGIVISVPACPPIIGIGGSWNQSKAACLKLQNNMVSIADKLGAKSVILHARWEILDENEFIKSQAPTGSGMETFRKPLNETVEAFRQRGISVYIISSTPSVDFPVPTALARWKTLKPNGDLRPTAESYLVRNQSAIKLFGMPEIRSNAEIIDLYNWFCREGERGRCDVAEGNHPYYYDSNHLTFYGSLALSTELNRLFADARN